MIRNLQVKVNNHWVNFSIFRSGKYKGEIEKWERNHFGCGRPENEELMIFAEALETDVKYQYVDLGICKIVKFRKGKDTELKVCVDNTFCNEIEKAHHETGGFIGEDWEGELKHVIDI